MTTISKQKGATGHVECVTVRWLAGDCKPVSLDLVDRCVQVAGEFGSSDSVTIEGSNDGELYFALTDIPGTLGRSLVFTEPGLRMVAENPICIRPQRDGPGAKDATVTLVGRPR
jgi:hypothetical protein